MSWLRHSSGQRLLNLDQVTTFGIVYGTSQVSSEPTPQDSKKSYHVAYIDSRSGKAIPWETFNTEDEAKTALEKLAACLPSPYESSTSKEPLYETTSLKNKDYRTFKPGEEKVDLTETTVETVDVTQTWDSDNPAKILRPASPCRRTSATDYDLQRLNRPQRASSPVVNRPRSKLEEALTEPL